MDTILGHAGLGADDSTAAIFRAVRSKPEGLSSREAQRRLLVDGPNELQVSRAPPWPAALLRQLVHPLALLLWAAALLAWAAATPGLALAIAGVVLLNAGLALIQERQAERAVEALTRYLPERCEVLRDGGRVTLDVRQLVQGDVILLREGERIPADARLLRGALEVDMATLTGESVPVERLAQLREPPGPLLRLPTRVFSGTNCISGEAVALVLATGARTQLGRLAALSQSARPRPTPLERQVRRVAWLIAAVAVAGALAFVPIGVFAAGLPFGQTLTFGIGLLVANVPEGLLPTITLALAVGARALAHRGVLVKRLSAVETLGATTVICTDKTGTLTQNSMAAVGLWTTGTRPLRFEGAPAGLHENRAATAMIHAVTCCNDAELSSGPSEVDEGEPMELALLRLARGAGEDVRPQTRERRRQQALRFDPLRKLMSTVDDEDGQWILHTKGAPEVLVARCVRGLNPAGEEIPLSPPMIEEIRAAIEAFAQQGLRVIGAARKRLAPGEVRERDQAENGLTFLGLLALEDPPRPEVAEAVAKCKAAGIRIVVITGDHGLTAAAIAKRVGISAAPRIVTGDELDELSEPQLDALLNERSDLVFARSSPEAKLRIADALRDLGQVVAMTGDGVNDAPALRRADIGVAMGRSGTEVAREAATMVLTDDNFASIVAAVEEGRRVYDNIRKFIVYILAHLTPEVVPFLVFAVSGGAVPIPLGVLQILAIDLGTETLPALALGRERGEPGLMHRPPRPRTEGIIRPNMLVRGWLFLGLLSAALVMTGFFAILVHGGWRPGLSVAPGTPLHLTYLKATTMTFLGIVSCQLGTGFAARAERASLRQIGVLSNRWLLWGVLFEIAFAGAIVLIPPLQRLFGTAVPDGEMLTMLPAFPVVVWGADELLRALARRRDRRRARAA